MIGARFHVDTFNRASITTVSVVFASICILTVGMLDGFTRNGALIISTLLLAAILWHMARSAVRCGSDGLCVGAGLFKRRVSYADIVAIAAEDRPRLGWRLNGIGFPGFALGWFSGAGGKRLFVAAGDRRSALRLSLRGSFDVLVSVANRDALERALRAKLD